MIRDLLGAFTRRAGRRPVGEPSDPPAPYRWREVSAALPDPRSGPGSREGDGAIMGTARTGGDKDSSKNFGKPFIINGLSDVA